MKNLEQIRAKNAMMAALNNLAGKNGGEVIKKIPPLIMNHGLLAISAYAYDDKNIGFKGAVDAIAIHLSDKDIALIPALPANSRSPMEHLLNYLVTEADSNQLRLCTAEAMAWLDYARRFIKRG